MNRVAEDAPGTVADQLLDVIAMALRTRNPAVGMLLLNHGAGIVLGHAITDEPGGSEDDRFEEWLLRRWTDHVRSDQFQGTAKHRKLVAAYEREQRG